MVTIEGKRPLAANIDSYDVVRRCGIWPLHLVEMIMKLCRGREWICSVYAWKKFVNFKRC